MFNIFRANFMGEIAGEEKMLPAGAIDVVARPSMMLRNLWLMGFSVNKDSAGSPPADG
jgi:hypothetical protein